MIAIGFFFVQPHSIYCFSLNNTLYIKNKVRKSSFHNLRTFLFLLFCYCRFLLYFTCFIYSSVSIASAMSGTAFSNFFPLIQQQFQIRFIIIFLLHCHCLPNCTNSEKTIRIQHIFKQQYDISAQ